MPETPANNEKAERENDEQAKKMYVSVIVEDTFQKQRDSPQYNILLGHPLDRAFWSSCFSQSS